MAKVTLKCERCAETIEVSGSTLRVSASPDLDPRPGLAMILLENRWSLVYNPGDGFTRPRVYSPGCVFGMLQELTGNKGGVVANLIDILQSRIPGRAPPIAAPPAAPPTQNPISQAFGVGAQPEAPAVAPPSSSAPELGPGKAGQ